MVFQASDGTLNLIRNKREWRNHDETEKIFLAFLTGVLAVGVTGCGNSGTVPSSTGTGSATTSSAAAVSLSAIIHLVEAAGRRFICFHRGYANPPWRNCERCCQAGAGESRLERESRWNSTTMSSKRPSPAGISMQIITRRQTIFRMQIKNRTCTLFLWRQSIWSRWVCIQNREIPFPA